MSLELASKRWRKSITTRGSDSRLSMPCGVGDGSHDAIPVMVRIAIVLPVISAFGVLLEAFGSLLLLRSSLVSEGILIHDNCVRSPHQYACSRRWLVLPLEHLASAGATYVLGAVGRSLWAFPGTCGRPGENGPCGHRRPRSCCSSCWPKP